jgi:hypothetical protein
VSFARKLTDAAAQLTASEAAAAVSVLLSRRTMEEWLQDRRTPPEWTHEWILARVTARAKRKTRARGANSRSEQFEGTKPL